jgi:hypothetical protein
VRAVAVVAVLAACGHPAAPGAQPTAGVTIAMYSGGSGYAVVDERRWVELSGDELELDHVDLGVTRGAALASLVIEPLDDPHLAIDRCARVEVASAAEPAGSAGSAAAPLVRSAPTIRCHVAGAQAGRRLVRILYTSPLAYRAEHAIAVVDGDHASIASRFAIETPRWGERAELVLFDGEAGGERAPREVARGEVVLDGSTAVLAAPARVVPAHLRRIFDGAVPTPELGSDVATWHGDSTRAVWVWLELGTVALAPGRLRVHVDLPGEGVRDVDADHAIAADGGALRVPLWPDPTLSGVRQRVSQSDDLGMLVESFTLSVANLGDQPRAVWIEEEVRPLRHRRLLTAKPAPPHVHGDVLRSELEIAPRAIELVRYTVEYEL